MTISFDDYLNTLFWISLVGAVVTSILVYRKNRKEERKNSEKLQ
jgi:Na+/H+ antiporter NhaD/arsenite permease-like protein